MPVGGGYRRWKLFTQKLLPDTQNPRDLQLIIGRNMENTLLWSPSNEQIENSRLTAFASYASKQTGTEFNSYEKLHHWSCQQGGEFW